MPGRHSKDHATTGGRSQRGTGRRAVLVSVTVVAIVAVGAFVVYPKTGTSRAATAPVPTGGASNAAAVAVPFTLTAVTPANAATAVPTDAGISVTFSTPLAPGSPQPTLSPPVAGSWQLLTPTTFTFVATAPLVPFSTESITVPATVQSASGKVLGTPTTVQFSVATGTTLRLQQLLASLGYLPVSFTPAAPLAAPQEAAQAQAGTFAWRWNEPPSLVALWTQGADNVITRGAVMAFENHHGLKTDGVAGPAVWQALLSDAAAGTMDNAPYDYVYVSQALPESTTVYSNGAQVYSTPANTGVPAAPTATGTFPVYERLTSTTMSGTNPDGSKYSDPGIPWVSYFNGGDALHGFVRSSYGFPQSVGCVEMPPANAAVVYPLTPIGTLVTVA